MAKDLPAGARHIGDVDGVEVYVIPDTEESLDHAEEAKLASEAGEIPDANEDPPDVAGMKTAMMPQHVYDMAIEMDTDPLDLVRMIMSVGKRHA